MVGGWYGEWPVHDLQASALVYSVHEVDVGVSVDEVLTCTLAQISELKGARKYRNDDDGACKAQQMSRRIKERKKEME